MRKYVTDIARILILRHFLSPSRHLFSVRHTYYTLTTKNINFKQI